MKILKNYKISENLIQLIQIDSAFTENSAQDFSIPIDPLSIYDFSEDIDVNSFSEFLDSESTLLNELSEFLDNPNLFPPDLYTELQEFLEDSSNLSQ